ncbi:MAG: DUF58 domain-containing protein [Anaerolineae bacterium]|nr:DUF58 domain-containing protein [Anaerolineae bacterium]MDH7475664.1 DUF58 domain-containing protein [Anaerolineae bacterium]
MRQRFFIVLTLCLVSLVAALTVPGETGRYLLYRLTYLLASILVLSYLWSWSSIRWLDFSRRPRTRRSEVGKLVEEWFQARNRGVIPKLWVEIWDESDLPGYRASRVLSAVGARQRRRWRVKTICWQRGSFKLGPTTIVGGDPFGLFQKRRRIEDTTSLVVYPAIVDLTTFAQPLGQLPGGDAVRRRTHHITTNVSSVRDYAPGDSFNRIHWPSTARKERLIVKEFELDPTADVWIFLDMEARVQGGQQEEIDMDEEGPALLRARRTQPRLMPTTEEYGVTIAASLAKYFSMRDRAVGLVTYGQRREVLQADRGERQLAKILETLAVIRAQGLSSLAQVLAVESKHLRRGTTLLIITPSTDRRWVLTARDLTRRGLHSTAVLLDAKSFGREADPQPLVAELAASHIPTYVVRRDDDLRVALSRQVVL